MRTCDELQGRIKTFILAAFPGFSNKLKYLRENKMANYILTKKKILVIAERGYCPHLTKRRIDLETRYYNWNIALSLKWRGGSLNKLKKVLPLSYEVINMLPPSKICGSWDKSLAKEMAPQIINYLKQQTEYCAVILLGRRVTDALFPGTELGTIKKFNGINILCAYHTASRTGFWSVKNAQTSELIHKLTN